MAETDGIKIRNMLLVEVVEYGEVIAKAVRATTEHAWYIGILIKQPDIDSRWDNAAIIQPWLPEVMQRKMVLALLREFDPASKCRHCGEKVVQMSPGLYCTDCTPPK